MMATFCLTEYLSACQLRASAWLLRVLAQNHPVGCHQLKRYRPALAERAPDTSRHEMETDNKVSSSNCKPWSAVIVLPVFSTRLSHPPTCVGEWVDCLAVQRSALLRGKGFRAMGAGQLWGCHGREDDHVPYHLRHAAADALDRLAARDTYKYRYVICANVGRILPPWGSAKHETRGFYKITGAPAPEVHREDLEQATSTAFSGNYFSSPSTAVQYFLYLTTQQSTKYSTPVYLGNYEKTI